LTHKEVGFVNDATQIYTRDYIYCRSETPKLTDAFKARAFRIAQFHRFDWLDAVMQAVASYVPKRTAS
jgi:hypothetical protein